MGAGGSDETIVEGKISELHFQKSTKTSFILKNNYYFFKHVCDFTAKPKKPAVPKAKPQKKKVKKAKKTKKQTSEVTETPKESPPEAVPAEEEVKSQKSPTEKVCFFEITLVILVRTI